MSMPCPVSLAERFCDLQRYVSWTEADAERLRAVGSRMDAYLPALVEDFYQAILRHANTRGVLESRGTPIEALKQTLLVWLRELFTGPYDIQYAEKHWRVGRRHVEIGLPQVYTNVAMSRIRAGLVRAALQEAPQLGLPVAEVIESICRILDLDLAIIDESYASRVVENQMQAERQRGDRKFRNLVEAAASVVLILYDESEIAYLSPFAERISGWDPERAVGQSFWRIFVDPLPIEADRRLWREALSEVPTQGRELPIHGQDGVDHWLIWNLRKLDDYEGRPATLAVGQDITEKRRADQRLVQAERLAAIGQTIAGLAHESRNSLQRIHSCTEMLEFEVEDRPEAMALIRRSQQAQDDLTRLFDEVRSFAAPITLERAPCRASSVWREAWQLLNRERQGRRAELVEAIEEPEPQVSIDRFRLVQVFRNLFENSLAACPDPGIVEVSCRTVAKVRAAAPSSVPAAADAVSGDAPPAGPAGPGFLEIRVHDNGPGLSPKAKADVFEPFFTTKSKGTGLGMAIAKRILAAHGGSISVGDSTRPGAEFVLYLPRDV
jgi:PAS domain S-box-containing protein